VLQVGFKNQVLVQGTVFFLLQFFVGVRNVSSLKQSQEIACSPQIGHISTSQPGWGKNPFQIVLAFKESNALKWVLGRYDHAPTHPRGIKVMLTNGFLCEKKGSWRVKPLRASSRVMTKRILYF